MGADLPERPVPPPPQPSPTRRAGGRLAALALVGPVALILGWYGLVLAVGAASRGTVWPLGQVFVLAGGAGLVWFAERNRIRRRWTALAVLGYLAATAFWAVLLFLTALSISCDGADPCFN